MPQLWANKGAFYRFNNILSSANCSKCSPPPPTPFDEGLWKSEFTLRWSVTARIFSSSHCVNSGLPFKSGMIIIIIITIIEPGPYSVVQADLELTA